MEFTTIVHYIIIHKLENFQFSTFIIHRIPPLRSSLLSVKRNGIYPFILYMRPRDTISPIFQPFLAPRPLNSNVISTLRARAELSLRVNIAIHATNNSPG